MERKAVRVAERAQRVQIVERQRGAPRAHVRRFDRHDAGRRALRVVGVAQRVLQRVERNFAARVRRERVQDDAADHGHSPRLVVVKVGIVADEQFPAALALRENRAQIGHRARRQPAGGLLAEQVGRIRFEPVGAGVFAIDVVADVGLVHRLAHGCRGQGDGVAQEVELDGLAAHAGISSSSFSVTSRAIACACRLLTMEKWSASTSVTASSGSRVRQTSADRRAAAAWASRAARK